MLQKYYLGLFLMPAVLCSMINTLLVQQAPFQLVESDPLVPSFSQVDLHSLSVSEFSTLTHPSFPDHHVRIKETKGFCDPTVRVYTGYIDIEHRRKHLFFYFFESRRDPDQDDVLMWINGGPGGSSAIGLLSALGPCNIDLSSPNGTAWNKWGWNRQTNLLFLDQPIEVGYSYGNKTAPPNTTPDAARDVHAFLIIWFETFSKFKGRPFHLAGESYGGRYIPVFASHIWDMNQLAHAHGRTPINLQSIMIGNGWTNPAKIHGSYYDMLCKNSTVTPFYPIEMCAELVYTAPECEKKILESCGRNYNKFDCRAAFAYCETELYAPFYTTGECYYSRQTSCGSQPLQVEISMISVDRAVVETWNAFLKLNREYLSKNSTKDMLGVPRSKDFDIISLDVNTAFMLAGDISEHSDAYVVGLLERGVRVLIYVGTNDLACNFIGNYRTVQGFDWSRSEAFNNVQLKDWSVNGHVAGETKTHGRLTFATVRGAGHLVPSDKPVESAYLVEHWMANTEL